METLSEIVQMIWLLITSLIETILQWTTTPREKDISDDIVLITGAAQGLGRELALQFYKQKSTIILMDINKSGCEETREYVHSVGGVGNSVFIFTCDVSQFNLVKDSIEDIQRSIGDISILVNNAGIVNTRSLSDISAEQYARTVSVNLLAHAWTTKCCLPAMIANRKGHIVTVSSILGLLACNKISEYCASKFGVVGFHESLATDMMVLEKRGIGGLYR